jgi:hypothetical protein
LDDVPRQTRNYVHLNRAPIRFRSFEKDRATFVTKYSLDTNLSRDYMQAILQSNCSVYGVQ